MILGKYYQMVYLLCTIEQTDRTVSLFLTSTHTYSPERRERAEVVTATRECRGSDF